MRRSGWSGSRRFSRRRPARRGVCGGRRRGDARFGIGGEEVHERLTLGFRHHRLGRTEEFGGLHHGHQHSARPQGMRHWRMCQWLMGLEAECGVGRVKVGLRGGEESCEGDWRLQSAQPSDC